jgi:hypothetical protein
VRHARSAALDEVEPLLEQLRRQPGLVEKSRGVFYRGSKAFLHFHEDPSGLHADVRLGEQFERHRAETADERQRLLALISERCDRDDRLPPPRSPRSPGSQSGR